MVHIDPSVSLPDHVYASAEIPDDLEIVDIEESLLPEGWRKTVPPVMLLRDIGTNWLQSKRTAVARVPAATTLGEFNYLLNPDHPHFILIRPGQPQAFEFDPRVIAAL